MQKLRFASGVTLIGSPAGQSDLSAALALAPALVCADGGANGLRGRTPDAIVGDLDSLADRAEWRRRLGDRLIQVEEQESTDFEKCLRLTDAPFFIGVGFLGGRLDHELAALHALIADPRPIVLIGAEDVALSAGAALSLDLEPGDRVSLFPMRPTRVLAGSGLRWPPGGLALAAGDRVGTSNEATGGPVELRFDAPGTVLILPRARLGEAVAAARARR